MKEGSVLYETAITVSVITIRLIKIFQLQEAVTSTVIYSDKVSIKIGRVQVSGKLVYSAEQPVVGRVAILEVKAFLPLKNN